MFMIPLNSNDFLDVCASYQDHLGHDKGQAVAPSNI